MRHDNLGRAFEELPPASESGARLGAFAVGIAGAFAAGTLIGALVRRAAARRDRERRLDRAAEDTFPASDPPAFAGGVIADHRGAREDG